MTTSSNISKYLNKDLHGSDITIVSFSELSNIEERTVVFANKYTDSFVGILNEEPNILAIVSPEYKDEIKCSYIVSENPRLDFMRVLSEFFIEENPNKGKIHRTAIIEDGAQIGQNATIGANCYISSKTVIGDNSQIHHNVIIEGDVRIGDNCVIKSGAIIGEEGFGFERNEFYIPEAFPHTGMVTIGNNVFIGSNSTVERGTIGATEIQDNVKIDDLVQIGHNSFIGENTMITVATLILGGVKISKNCYIGPNVTIREKIKVMEKAFIGMGAVVIRDVMPGKTVIGNPAKELIKK